MSNKECGMKYILLKLLAYDCAMQYEVDEQVYLLDTNTDIDTLARKVITGFLLQTHELSVLPQSLQKDVESYKVLDNGINVFEVDNDMVHVEVTWESIDVYSGIK